MVFKRFNVNVTIRLILLTFSIALLVFTIFEKKWPVTSIILCALIITIIIELFRFITKTNRDLAKFIDAINYKEYSVNFSGYKLGNAFDQLHDSFKNTLNLFKELRLEKEAHYQYILRLIKNIDVGIIAVDHCQKVVLYNAKAHQLLQLPNLVQWDRYKQKAPDFYNAIANQKGENKSLVCINNNTELSLRSSHFNIDGAPHFVLVFQNIKEEMETQEMNAWNQLIKILTHEIMNSVTPISSLSSTLLDIEKRNPHANEDVIEGLQTISKRSKSLIHFVNDYRKLAHIPSPAKKYVSVNQYFTSIKTLYQSKLPQLNIDFKLTLLAVDQEISLDEKLMYQVFDNLISNSIQALKNNTDPKINLDLTKSANSGLQINITDNGTGIAEHELGKVFIPFFSTKITGSGIGLSLARQIVQMHGGKIKVSSQVGKFCTFKINLPV
ncbi:MAG: sensor histidine kinase [Bacteroidia bacterium]